jgi:hypothetical protein
MHEQEKAAQLQRQAEDAAAAAAKERMLAEALRDEVRASRWVGAAPPLRVAAAARRPQGQPAGAATTSRLRARLEPCSPARRPPAAGS